MKLSDRIREIRQKALLTQDEFARQLTVAYSTVNRWETGKTRPNMTAMKQIKIFCEENHLSFEELQTAWLSRTKENGK